VSYGDDGGIFAETPPGVASGGNAERGNRWSMCARYTLRKRRLADVAEALNAEFAADDEALYKPRYNVAPTDLAWILVRGADRRVVKPARWKYMTKADQILVNIRGETMGFGRFRDAFATGRCAVVTDGSNIRTVATAWQARPGERVRYSLALSVPGDLVVRIRTVVSYDARSNGQADSKPSRRVHRAARHTRGGPGP